MPRKSTRLDRALALRDAVLRLAHTSSPAWSTPQNGHLTRYVALRLPDGTTLQGSIATPFAPKIPKKKTEGDPTMWDVTFTLPNGTIVQGKIPALFATNSTQKKTKPTWDYRLEMWDEKGKVLNVHWHQAIVGYPQDIEIVAFRRGPWEKALLDAETLAPANPRPEGITLRAVG